MEEKSEVGIEDNQDDISDIAMNVIEDVLTIFQIFFDLDLNYSMPSVEMFLNHLQLMSQRVATKKILNEPEDEAMYRHLSKMYSRAHDCVNEVAQRLKEKYGSALTFTERLYLLVHMQNILNAKKDAKF